MLNLLSLSFRGTCRRFDYEDVHVDGAGRIAKIAAESGVPRFVHVSHLNASKDSKSEFYQTKAEGEVRVKEYFRDASIVRPAIMYGYEDRLLNNIARAPWSHIVRL